MRPNAWSRLSLTIADPDAMRKAKSRTKMPDMRDEYDFPRGVRGKYADRFAAGTNVVVLEPDVAKAFPDSNAVNEALRALLRIAERKKLAR